MVVKNYAYWVIGAIIVLWIIALLAWARNDAGIDDRVPDPEDAIAVVEARYQAF
jgi:hypothetical protein